MCNAYTHYLSLSYLSLAVSRTRTHSPLRRKGREERENAGSGG